MQVGACLGQEFLLVGRDLVTLRLQCPVSLEQRRFGGRVAPLSEETSAQQHRRCRALPPANACLVVEAQHVAEGAFGLREALGVDLDLPEHHLRIQGIRVRLAERPPASGEDGAEAGLRFGEILQVPHQHTETVLRR